MTPELLSGTRHPPAKASAVNLARGFLLADKFERRPPRKYRAGQALNFSGTGVEVQMDQLDEELILREAVKTAWSVYLATHGDIDVSDRRLCSLSRHLADRLHAGETGVEELACAGLAYLDRLPVDDE